MNPTNRATTLSRSKEQQIKSSRLPRTEWMLRIHLFLHTGQTAVILPTTCALEPLKQVSEVLLATAIALFVLTKLPWRIRADFDDARPQQAVAVGIPACADTC